MHCHRRRGQRNRGPRSTQEAFRTLPFDFRLPERNAIFYPDTSSYGECRIRSCNAGLQGKQSAGELACPQTTASWEASSVKKHLSHKEHWAPGAMFTLRLAAILAMTVIPVRAADFSAADADMHARLLCTNRSCFVRPDLAGPLSQQRLLHRVAVFSDDPEIIHDPRHPQSQTGADKMFAPIGLIGTNHRVPHQSGTTTTLNFDMGTAFLVSPCYILTNYHVVFGNRKSKPEADRDYSMTFSVGGKKSRAVPAKYGEFYRFEGGIGPSCTSTPMQSIDV